MAETKARWYYMLLRWVPNPARGEFVNIGAIVFDDTDEQNMAVRFSGFTRANRLDRTPEELHEIIGHMLDSLWGAEPAARQEVGLQMVHDYQNIVQFTPPLPMVASSAGQALDFIFPKLVGDE